MSKHILLVENDADYRATVKQSLVNAGFLVTEAESEQQAYEAAAKQKFDLAVVNLMLENSDSGFTLSYHFKKDYPAMQIVLLSNTPSAMDIEFSMESAWERNWIRADALLNKPIRCEQILASVQRLLGCAVCAH